MAKRIPSDMIEDRSTGEKVSTTLSSHATQLAEKAQQAELTRKTPWINTDTLTGDAIQALINAASSGDTILLKPGRYTVSSQISWSNKQLHIVALGNVVFVEQSPLNVPMILMANAHDSTIRGISCEGAETLAGFAGDSTKHYSFIKVVTSNNVKIYDSIILNKSYGVIFDNCNKCKVYNPDMTGFLVTGDITSNGANYSAGVYMLGGKKNSVVNFSVKDMGSGVLVGGDGKNHTISTGYLENMRDNGIYISSGSGCKVIDVDVDSAISTAIKTRGSKHHVKDNNVKNALLGFSLTGNGTTPDSLGYNGHGTKCTGNVAESCTRMGLEIGVQDGYYPRDFEVIENTFINCGEVGSTYAPIKIYQGAGHKIRGNTIDRSASDYGILINGASTDKCKRYDISNNLVRGNGTTPKNGIRLLYVDASVVCKNIFESLAIDGVDARYVTNSTIDGNEYPESLVVSLSSAYQSTGNVVSNNIGSNIAPDLTQNTAFGNKPEYKNFHTSIASAPYATGQKALVSGVIYEAIGTSAATDWKQIS